VQQARQPPPPAPLSTLARTHRFPPAGKGGSFFGPLYGGGGSLNAFNTSARTPGNADARDPAMRRRLYDEALAIVNEVCVWLCVCVSGVAGGVLA
jgi:hypothetical protein